MRGHTRHNTVGSLSFIFKRQPSYTFVNLPYQNFQLCIPRHSIDSEYVLVNFRYSGLICWRVIHRTSLHQCHSTDSKYVDILLTYGAYKKDAMLAEILSDIIASKEVETNAVADLDYAKTASVHKLISHTILLVEVLVKFWRNMVLRRSNMNFTTNCTNSGRRLNYCNHTVFHYILTFPGESGVANPSMFNRQSIRHWAKENQWLVRDSTFQSVLELMFVLA